MRVYHIGFLKRGGKSGMAGTNPGILQFRHFSGCLSGAMAFLKTGCCGFPLPKLRYSVAFPVVEVQTTFYQPPRITTLQGWRAMLPPPFEFTLKAWQLITHTARSPTFRRIKAKLTARELAQCGGFRSTAIVQRAWEVSRDCAEALGARLLLFQCPASFTPSAQNVRQLRRFFTGIDRHDLTLLWEPRGIWPAELVRSLCRELNLVHAVDPFVCPTVTPEFLYFRLHGGKDFRQVFTVEELLSVVRLIPGDQRAYVMFNNRTMLPDATTFQKLATFPDSLLTSPC